MAHRGEGRQGDDRVLAEPGQSTHGREARDPRARRLGARVLPQVPEPPSGLHRGVVERGELGRGGQALRWTLISSAPDGRWGMREARRGPLGALRVSYRPSPIAPPSYLAASPSRYV